MKTKLLKMNCSSGASSSRSASSNSDSEAYDTVWECVFPHIEEPVDRGAVSLVCKRWFEIDGTTRKHVTIAMCYSVTPDRLLRRFPHLDSLKIKGKPRAAMFNLIPEDWGGYVTLWVEKIVGSSSRIKSLHFRRMIVKDSDLELLASSATGKILEVLKLDKCSGFSTDGLLHITRSCRSLRTLFMEDSTIVEKDGEWLHELALKNTVLENLNYYLTDLGKVIPEDLELIARKCASLVSMKISDCDISNLIDFFRDAVALEEFSGGVFNDPAEHNGEGVCASNKQLQRYPVTFPPRLCCFDLTYLGKADMPIIFPVASRLKKLDLLYALLDTDGHCLLLQRCPNLEILESRNVIGDRGLEVLAQFCKRLKRLKIEGGPDEMEDVEGVITQRGLNALSQGCLELEHLTIYVSDVTNASLESVGTYLKKLRDFRLILIEKQGNVTDLPLDNGVRSMLMGCHDLKRLALYLRPGIITDVGLGYIGRYGTKLRYVLLGCVGGSDKGILEFAKGCRNLQKIEMRGCEFSEHALALAALQLTSLKYLWAQGYRASASGWDLLHLMRPNWITELIPARQFTVRDANGEVTVQNPAHILAYYSLAGQRTDFPPSVRPLIPSIYKQ